MNRTSWMKLGLAAAGAVALGVVARNYRKSALYSLAGKTVLITGGSRGLGLILARKVGQMGARVVICARQEEALQRALVDLQQRQIHAWAIPCDVTQKNAVQAMVDQIRQSWGEPDVVINNAGIIQMGPVESLTDADFDATMKTHFWGPWNVMQAVVPGMRQRGAGRIVNIASIGGKISVPHLLAYNSSKFALVGLSQGMAAELAKDGIHVTTVCPGLMRTGSPRNADFKGQHRSEYAWFSISDSLPGVSMNADYAADQIIDALRQGKTTAILGVPAKLAVLFQGLFPELTIRGLAAANQLLPRFGGIGRSIAKGRDSESTLSPSLLTQLTEQAAVRNNELLT